MSLLQPEKIWEMIRLEQLLPDIVDKIFNEYNTKTEAGIKAALRQAAWVGMCEGKGWE